MALLLDVGCSSMTLGSGNIVTKRISVSSFSRIEVASAFDMTISTGQSDEVILRVDDNVVDDADVGVSNGVLHIGLRSGSSVNDVTLEAEVTAQSLSSVEASGASRVHLSKELTGQRLDLSLSGAGSFDGTVRVDEVKVDLAGSSRMTLAGSAGHLVVQEAGASNLNADRLQALDVTIDLAGASRASVSATDTISANVSGASRLEYRGNPKFVRKEVSGGSSVTPA